MMANLNFQQPPRSIANSFSSNNSSSSNTTNPLNNNINSSGSINSNSAHVISSLMASSGNNSLATTTANNNNSSSSLSGHVTPTTAMFNNGGGSGVDRGGQQQQQQMPIGGGGGPNSAPGGGNAGGGQNNSLLGFRSYSSFNQVNNARSSSMPNNSNMNKSILSRTTGPFGLVGGGGSGGLQNYQSVFGGIGVGMVKQQASEQSEFQMSNEDFPALPGTQHQHQSSVQQQQQQQQGGNDQGAVSTASSVSGLLSGNSGGGGVLGNIGEGSNNIGGSGIVGGGIAGGITNGAGGVGSAMMGMELPGGGSLEEKQQQQMMMKRAALGSGGVQTSPDGKVTNIPASMVNNQYGMIGLLTFLRESDPNLVSLAMGQDLTTLGLNLNSSENLYPSFGGPFADQPCRPQDIDFHVPPEYLVNMSIREKLSPFQLKKYKDDLLFFLFYTNVGDAMQIMVAEELQSRDWRYHIEEKVWITRMPGHTIFEKNGTAERGVFYYFDAQNWRRVPRDSFIDTGKLAPTSRV